MEREHLVHEPVVAGSVMGRLSGEVGMGEESEDAEAVVDGYEDYTMIHERAVFVESARCGAPFVGAAVNPEHDGKGLGDGPLGNDDVEEEAIFLAGFGIVAVPVAKIRLRTGSAKCLGGTNAGPGLCGDRFSPAEIGDRWFGVGDAEELRPMAGTGRTFELT